MRNHNVPREMQQRVQRWYDYAWSRSVTRYAVLDTKINANVNEKLAKLKDNEPAKYDAD